MPAEEDGSKVISFNCLPGGFQAKRLAPLPAISRLQNTDVNEFFHIVIDELCGKNFSYERYKGIEGVEHIISAYRLFFKQVICLDLKKELILEDLKKTGLSDGVANLVFESASSRRDDLRKAFTVKSSQISSASLVDFDWKINLILSSDKISSMQEPVVLLSLKISKGTKQGKDEAEDSEDDILLVELNKEELDNLVSTFGVINESIQALKS